MWCGMKKFDGISFVLLTAVLSLAFYIQPVHASLEEVAIIIEPNGVVIPPTKLIVREDDVYTFTDDIDCNGITVLRAGITINGNGYTVDGPGYGNGFLLFEVNDVTIKHTNIQNFRNAILLKYSGNNTIRGNTIADNDYAVALLEGNNNKLYHNNFINDNQQPVYDFHDDFPLIAPSIDNVWDKVEETISISTFVIVPNISASLTLPQ